MSSPLRLQAQSPLSLTRHSFLREQFSYPSGRKHPAPSSQVLQPKVSPLLSEGGFHPDIPLVSSRSCISL